MPKYTFKALPNWKLEIRDDKGLRRILKAEQPKPLKVTGEKHEKIPFYAEKKWLAGTKLDKLVAMECSISYSLLPETVKLKLEDGTVLIPGVDYMVDPVWGAFGRLHDSDIGEETAVYADYSYFPPRIDTVFRKGDSFIIRKGSPNGSTPLLPEKQAGEIPICNLFFDRMHKHFSDDQLFPVLEKYKAEDHSQDVERQLARTLKKLRAGKKVKILFWGDSVTACKFIPEERFRWPVQVVKELRKRFPKAEIEYVNLGWGGKAVNTFQCEPPGSPYNYEEKVVNSGADLVFLEFVNDAYLTMKPEFDRIYNRVRDDFRAKKMDLIVILPHLVRPDWMGLTSQKNIEEDPRPYIRFLREFVEENDYACADVSGRFLHLWKEGFPYNALMLNGINHPDRRGIKLFTETVLDLLPKG